MRYDVAALLVETGGEPATTTRDRLLAESRAAGARARRGELSLDSESYLLRLNVLTAERLYGRDVVHTSDTGDARLVVRLLLDGWA